MTPAVQQCSTLNGSVTSCNKVPMSKILTYADIIATWPPRRGLTPIQAFATDMGVRYSAAVLMKHRNSIPAIHWARLIAKRKARGLKDVDFQTLAKIAETRAAGQRRKGEPATG